MWHAARVPRFDAELYLRLAGERELLDERRRHRPNSPLVDAAAALIATGAIDSETGAAIVADYGLAQVARSGGYAHERFGMRPGQGASRPSPPAVGLPARRFVPIVRDIELDWGVLTIRYAGLSDDATTLGVRLRFDAAGAGQANMHGPPGIHVGDDRGTTSACHFNGGGSDMMWSGEFEADAPLAADTAWIEVEGERIELVHSATEVEVRVEPVELEPVAWRYLWHSLAAGDVMWTETDLGEAAAALVAAGLIDRDDPQLGEIAVVSSQMGYRGRMLRHGPPSGAAPTVREPWRSLLATHGRSGIAATLLVGAVTPIFDGVSVGVSVVDLREREFEARVEIAPGGVLGHRFGRSELSPALAWWASDDRGHHYLGHMGQWSGGGDRESGTVEFPRPFDPRARRLDLMPTTLDARAIISIPVPEAPETSA